MELLPCPFCGSNDISENLHDYMCNKCKSCALKNVWSTRHSPWISVKDRLPPVGRKVIIFTNSSYLAWHSENDEFMDFYDNKIINHVTHWMPLPQPPKEP